MNIAGFDGSSYQEILGNLKNVNINFNFGGGALAIAAYILLALGLYTIAKRRGIQRPWLAWIPIASSWLLGCISDQYHYVTNGEVRSRRKRMLALDIVKVSITVLILVLAVVCSLKVGVSLAAGIPEEAVASVLVLLCLMLLLVLPLVVAAIWLLVETFYAYYDLFCSCNPENKTLFTVLSIVASCLGYDILAAVFVFICRNKEEGMPPRKEEGMPLQVEE